MRESFLDWFRLLIADRDDPALSHQFRGFMRLSVTSIPGTPVMYAGSLVGIMCFGSDSKHIFDKRQIDIARGISNHATLAIQNPTMHERTKSELERERHIAEKLQQCLFPEELPAQGIADAVYEECLAFADGKHEDDIAILVLKRV